MTTTLKVLGYYEPSPGVKQPIEIELGQAASPSGQNGVGITSGLGSINHVQVTLTAKSIATTDNSTSGAQGSLKFMTFPEGLIHVLAASTNMTIARAGTALAATAAVVGAIG